MNYITKLREIKLEAREQNQNAQDGMLDLLTYLCSSKFQHNKTVQVQDVLNRLAPIQSALNEQRDILKDGS